MAKSSFRSAAFAVFRREVTAELRSRIAIAAVLFFALAALVLLSFSVGPVTLPEADRARVNAGLLWVLLFFSASTGLPRSYVREEESGTLSGLRKIVGGETVLAGKLVFNYVLFLAIAAVTVPALSILLAWTIRRPLAMAGILALAGFGLSLVATFLSAIVSRAGQKNVLFVLTAFPLMLPLLLPAVSATALCASGAQGELPELLRVLVAYDGAAGCAAFVLIRFVWDS